MDELSARAWIDTLPLSERLRLARDILADIEGHVGRARAELDALEGQALLPGILDGLAPPAAAVPGGLPAPEGSSLTETGSASVPGKAAAQSDEHDGIDPDGGWTASGLPPLPGEILPGRSVSAEARPAVAGHPPIDHLRLMDAARHYERLLKHYGYIRGLPPPREILRAEHEGERQRRRHSPRSRAAWAEWVGRDDAPPESPADRAWRDWVAIGDDEGED